MSSVLLTGASSGIGLATALNLGRAGHTVYATMRNPDKAPQLRETLAKEKLLRCIQTFLPEMRQKRSGCHYQCEFGGWSHRLLTPGPVQRIEIRS
jgi:nucleoside-diphosphate-sugar epimerase